LLAVLPETDAAGDLAETLSTQPDIVLADESLLAPTALACFKLAGSLCGLLASLLF
jgi:hypothetical protein